VVGGVEEDGLCVDVDCGVGQSEGRVVHYKQAMRKVVKEQRDWMLDLEVLLMFRIFLEGLLDWIKAGGGTRQNFITTANQ
jgi:hypothetical protein